MSPTSLSADGKLSNRLADRTRTETGRASPLSTLWSGLIRRVARRLLQAAGNPPLCVAFWDGTEIVPADATPIAKITVRSPAVLLGLLVNPSWRFAEAYVDGRLKISGDLTALLTIIDRALLTRSRPGRWQTFRARLATTANSLNDARRNAHEHYDLSNDFYRLWLDEQLVYTCAYFARPDLTLEEAQIAKMEHVCRKLQLRPGQTVVEAGCGWGALALYMARQYGVRVKAYNVSREQIVAARRWAAAEGLQGLVEFVEADWRSIEGRFDAFASVGMLEHVGPSNYKRLGDVIDRCLKPGGRGLIHSIGRNATFPLDTWTRRRIFPGAHVPSLVEMQAIFEPHQFSILDVENLRLHYATTLRHWLSRYERSVDEVERLFGERFVRLWRLYLAGSVAAFDTGWLQLFQIVFARPDDNSVPQTREHLYVSAAAASPARLGS